MRKNYLAFWRERRAGRCATPRRRRCVATQALRRNACVARHRRGAATKQMPARRRAPTGCGPQARWLRCSLLTCSRHARRSRLASVPGARSKMPSNSCACPKRCSNIWLITLRHNSSRRLSPPSEQTYSGFQKRGCGRRQLGRRQQAPQFSVERVQTEVGVKCQRAPEGLRLHNKTMRQ
jgi:hypothetical protein